MTSANSDQPTGPFRAEDLRIGEPWSLRDGHLVGRGVPGAPGPLAGLESAVRALRAVDCAPEARLLETMHPHLLDMLLEALLRGLRPR